MEGPVEPELVPPASTAQCRVLEVFSQPSDSVHKFPQPVPQVLNDSKSSHAGKVLIGGETQSRLNSKLPIEDMNPVTYI